MAEQPSRNLATAIDAGYDSGLSSHSFEEEPIPASKDTREERLERVKADDTHGGGAPWMSEEGVAVGLGNNKVMWDKTMDRRTAMDIIADDPCDPRLHVGPDQASIKNVPQVSMDAKLSQVQFAGKAFNPKVEHGMGTNLVNHFPITMSKPPAEVTGWMRGLLIAMKVLQAMSSSSEGG